MLSTKLKEAAGNSADATLYVDDVFSTYLYTGTGAAQTITNGIDLAGKGGLVWIKDRTSANSHQLIDTSRGGSSSLASNSNATPTTGTYITSFNSDGFSLSNYAYINASGDNFASWTFRKAAKFFDVVTYTGTGSARTIAHSLGVAPGMIIVKRTDTSGNWRVYSNGLTSATYFVSLDLTDAQASGSAIWDSTAPTSSVFSVGVNGSVNASGGTYVAYLFAHDTDADGIIQCGTFTSDGSGNATVNLGWEPQYLLMKNSTSVNDWYVFDSMRGFSMTSEASLAPNSSAAETPWVPSLWVPTATGFQVKAVWPSLPTIYMAIRMPNKPPTSGTQVYNGIARDGTGSPTTITGVGFPPDWVHAKSRTLTKNNLVIDRLRGGAKNLLTDDTTSEQTSQTATAFNQDGITVGADAEYAGINAVSGYPYINHFFKRAPGFFDEVCWTGNNGSNQRVSHNLTVVPELIIYKGRNKVNYWRVYYGNINQYIALNLDSAVVSGSNFWGSSAPTTTDFGINCGSMDLDNFNAVAYLFATLAGISKVGSYTGNGTGQAIACGFSAGARFVLIKRTDSTGPWYTFDSARGLTVGSSPYLLLNSTAAEVTGNNGVYASTGGFTLDATAITTTNIATATYIFLAVA